MPPVGGLESIYSNSISGFDRQNKLFEGKLDKE